MPKKFLGENSKAVAARQRKKSVKGAGEVKVQKEVDDDFWREDNKNVNKKLKRKEELESKKRQQLEKKAENKAMLEDELKSIEGKKKQISKITCTEIYNNTTGSVSGKCKELKSHIDEPLEENVNRLQPIEIATTVDEALAMLSVNDDVPIELDDRHPEKRRNAAYLAFKEKHLPRLKIENPTFRISQLKQLLFKEWGKSPENPLNNSIS